MKPKRILLFTESLGSGGAERQLTGLAVLLKKCGYQVKVLTYYDFQFHEAYLRENGIDYELDVSIFNGIKGVISLYKKVKIFAPESIISCLPGPNQRMCLIRPLIHTNLIISERSHTQDWNFRTKLTFLLYRMSDKVVANSYSEVDNITTNCGWLKSKTIAIPNYVEVNKFVPIVKQPSDVIRMVTVGRLIPSKNAMRLLEVMNGLFHNGFNFKLTWVGSQSDIKYLEQVRGKVSEYELSDFVTLKDQTHDVVSEYQSGDIFCFPTLFEGYPNVLVEAMSCGLPVVCSNVCEMPNIVENGVNGFLFDPMNAKDMAKAIEQMLNLSLEERLEMGRRNREKVIKNNSMEKFVNQYINLL